MARLNSLDDTINKQQLLFGINQGAIYSDIRVEHAKRITDLDLDGYAVGGLAVGETHEEMYSGRDSSLLARRQTDLSDGSRYTCKYFGGSGTRRGLF